MENNLVLIATENDDRLTWTHKETDLSKPGNRKWLVSHIRWAAGKGRVVQITPIR